MRLRKPGLVLVVGLLGLPTTTMAQKGAEQLMRFKPIQNQKASKPLALGGQTSTCCPKCKDAWVTVVEKTFKAVRPEIRHQVLRHECSGCANTIVTEGHGKAKTDKVVHVCKEANGKDAPCCLMNKGSGPTPDMEQK